MRTRQPFYLNKAGMLATLIAAAFSPYAFALTPAGKIDFAFGTATATGADGTTRPLKKGTKVYTGDAITTTDGRVQIRFSDGAYVALQPNTLFKVDQYAYEGKSDGKEKGSFSLVKGGLRTITGAIGKVNKQNYEVRTPTATIGIRGTGYSADSDERGTTVSVHTGLVSVSNQGGTITLGKGQSTFVPTQQSSPQMTDQQAAADQILAERKQQEELEQQTQTERPLDTQTVNAAGDQRAPTGESLPLTQLTSGPTSGQGYFLGLVDRYTESEAPPLTDATLNFSGNLLTAYSTPFSLMTVKRSVGSTSQVQDAGWDGTIGWGRWGGEVTTAWLNNGTVSDSSTSYEDIHYFFGKLASADALALRQDKTVRYDLAGATRPTTSVSGSDTVTLGTLSGNAHAIANFSATATMTLHGTVFTEVANYALSDFGAMSIGNQATFSTSSAPSGSPSLNVQGAFIGARAERLGITYSIMDGGANTTGAATFKENTSLHSPN